MVVDYSFENIQAFFTNIVNFHIFRRNLFESLAKDLEDFIEQVDYNPLDVAVLLHDEFEHRVEKSDMDEIYKDFLEEALEHVSWDKVAERFLERYIKMTLPV